MQIQMINIINAYNKTNVKHKYNNVVQVSPYINHTSNVLSFDKINFGAKANRLNPVKEDFSNADHHMERIVTRNFFGGIKDGTTYVKSDFSNKKFNCNLGGQDFSESSFNGATFGPHTRFNGKFTSKFERCDFRGADLSQVPLQELKKAHFHETLYDEMTRFPKGYNPKNIATNANYINADGTKTPVSAWLTLEEKPKFVKYLFQE